MSTKTVILKIWGRGGNVDIFYGNNLGFFNQMLQIQRKKKKSKIYCLSFLSHNHCCFPKIASCSTLAIHQPPTHHALKSSLSSFISFLKSSFFCESFLHHFSPCWWLWTLSHLTCCPVCIVSIWVRLLGPYHKGLQICLCPSQIQERELLNLNQENSARFLLRNCRRNVLGEIQCSVELRSLCPAGSSTLSVKLGQRHEGKSYAADIVTTHSATMTFPQPDSIAVERVWLLLIEFFLCFLNKKHGEILRPFIALEISICLNCICA